MQDMNLSRRRISALVLVPLALLLGAACNPLGPPKSTVASVDVERFSGTWYEVASIPQFFSVGLVNTTATYSLQPDGSIKVVNSGRYFTKDGPLSTITGSAVALDSTNSKLNVSFAGAPSTTGPGNYWIVDLDPAYQWVIVSDPAGATGFLLTRTPEISPTLRAELLARAAAKGVDVDRMVTTPQN